VELPAIAVESLRRHRKPQLEEKLRAGSSWQESGLVFTRPNGGPLDPENQVKTFLHPLLKRAGVDTGGVTFHGLRHTFATLMFLNDEHPKVVQDALGHSSIAITMDRYSHYISQKQKDAARRLGELF
jgi:integrase